MDRILLVSPSPRTLGNSGATLSNRFILVTVNSGHEALVSLRKESFDAVALSLDLPDMPGKEVLQTIHSDLNLSLPVVILIDRESQELAAELMRAGAADVVPKDAWPMITERVERALHQSRKRDAQQSHSPRGKDPDERFVFKSEAMKKVHFEISRLAQLDFDVLITGETGVGKDIIAREIHRRSLRAIYPFMVVPMRTLTETLIETELFGHEKGAYSGADKSQMGKLEAANHGTVYIPEVSSLSEPIQLKLLQFLQYKTITRVGQDPRQPEKKLDVRVILATNEALEEVVRKGRMRSDFYYRITSVTLNVPPLRERLEDIGAFAEYFAQRYQIITNRESVELAPEVVPALQRLPWPGNVRELENWIKNALTFSTGTRLTLGDFPLVMVASQYKSQVSDCRTCMSARFRDLPGYQQAQEQFKRAYLSEALDRAHDRVSQAASMVGLTPQGFRKILASLCVENDPDNCTQRSSKDGGKV